MANHEPIVTTSPVRLTGGRLTPDDVVAIARGNVPVALGPESLAGMREAREVVESYLADGRDAYGLTTGLGAKVGESLPQSAYDEFSRQTVLGRANAVGRPLPTDVVRAAIAIRANGLARGGSGARPELAEALVALLERGVHPVVPDTGSIGAGDICLLAHVGLVLIGEGEAELGGQRLRGAAALAAAGLEPLGLAPKDGLALISANAVSAAWSALAFVEARDGLDALQAAAALAMEGFRANVSPLDERAAAAHPAPGQARSAAGLRALLAGGALTRSGGARRLQDPLSFRCVSQVHGSLLAALDLLGAALEPELNGAGDNPLVVTESREIISTGNFHVAALALAADAVALGVAQVATLSATRVARLLESASTDLPQNLALGGFARGGMGPLRKTADALTGEIVHRAAPVTLAIRVSDGVEDAATGAPLAAKRLLTLLDRLRLLTAVELIVAAQAVDLASPAPLGRGTRAAHSFVRELVQPLDDDRPLGGDIERVAEALASGRFHAAIGQAVAQP